ncbi:hypothetical protein WA026_015801 [Henosepilachna vigintioctopunctata]|uniref:Uncharacterized protein n=1 Tax=Henosepilachna vigintioctopunctata TaxID=420089 RepID=A0AAW1UYQ7_9CUCU
MNRMGPKTLPCGTPISLVSIVDLTSTPCLESATLCCLPDRYDSNQHKALFRTPIISNLFRIYSLNRQSYAFVRSKNSPNAHFPASIKWINVSVN